MRTHSCPQKPSLINAPSFFSRLVVLLLILAGSGYAQQEANKLFQSGLYQEEAKGDLGAAIQIYQQILKDCSGDRPACAKALLQMGGCYEKLGQTEARMAYERIINEYGDRKEEVAVATERMASLKKIMADLNQKPTFRKITIASNPQNGVLSPDGNRLATFSDGSVWIIPIHGKVNSDIAGEPIRIAKIPNAWDYDSLMSWSSDGNWIAINGEETEEGTVAYIIPMAGGESRTTTIPPRGGHSFSYRLSLSPDGQILTFSAEELGVQKKVQGPHDRRIYTIPVKGGEPKQVSSDGAQATLPSFSPDGRFIAYVGYSKGNIGELWIVPSSGGDPIKLAEVNGRLRGPIWSPECKYIAAHYEPGGSNSSNEIFVYALSSDLSTAGEPTKITLPGESYNLLSGWTPDNELGLFIQSEQHSAIYTVPATGGKAVQVSPDGQWPYYPRWSPNGKRIYFRPSYEPSPVLYVSATGGNPIGIPVASNQDLTCRVPGGGFNISPDGKKMVISAGGGKKRYTNEGNLWTIALDNGMPTQLPSDRYFSCRYPCWSPDGKWIAFIDNTGTQDKNYKESFRAIYVIPAAGGIIRQITSKADSVGGGAIAFSTNGEHIAFFSGSAIKTIPVEGGQSEVLVSDIKSFDHSQLAYSPDGTKIAHNAYDKIWITSLDEGIPHELQTGLPKSVRLSEFSWSPDGEKIAFFCSSGGEAEFWMVNNFLPLEKLAQNIETEVAKEPEGIVIKQVWTGPGVDNSGSVSLDGKYLSFVDWDTGDLALRNLNTKQNSSLVPGNWDTPMQYAQYSVISPNGKQIAYQWINDKQSDLYLINIDNPIPKLLYRIAGVKVYPLCWLSDKEIAIGIYKKGADAQIGSYSLLDGTIATLKTFQHTSWARSKSSPDKTSLAYDFVNESQDGTFDINILSMDGKGEIALVEHPANDKVLGWMPERNEFLFISDRSGTWDLWAIAVDNGKPFGQERRIYTDIGDVEPMGITKNGECFYGFSKRNFNAYILPVNKLTGKPEGKPEIPLAGSIYSKNWSPDGKYMTRVQEREGGFELIIRDVENGNERRLAEELLYVLGPYWSRDRQSVYIFGMEKKRLRTKGYEGGIFTVDLKSNKLKENLLISDFNYTPSKDDAKPISGHVVSDDNKYIYMLFQNDWIVKRNLANGTDTILYRHPGFVRGVLQLSPDGKKLLFAVHDKEEKQSRLITISVNGGDERELCTSQEVKISESAFWSPNGKSVYFTESQEGTSLWRVNSEGGTPEKVWHTDKRAESFAMHPSGEKISYSVRERITEVRVIEGLVNELNNIYSLNE